MSDVNPYIRVNGEMLHSLSGRNVCLLGKFSKISPNQMSFELISPDGKKVNVNLKVGLRDTLSEIVEVYGSVDDRGNINCINYTTFDNSATHNFEFKIKDMDLYNETLQVMHQLPKHYAQAV